jgi:hypothetical protein
MPEFGRGEIEAALQKFSQGDHVGAVDTVRPAADAGDRVALALIAWFQSQRGEPHWREGIAYAEEAVRKGVPVVANPYVGPMLGDSTLRTRVPDLVRAVLQAGGSLDGFGLMMTPIGQGDLGTGVRIAEAASTPSLQPEGWKDLVERVTTEWDAVTAAVAASHEARDVAIQAIEADKAAVAALRNDVESRSSQLAALIEQTTNAEVQGFFENEATKYEGEARRAWWAGIALLAGAALFAVAPLVIYFVGTILDKDWLADQNLTAAHFAPALALGAVAGVLLARARGRDRARQRARDLSVALVTMFVYSAQITSPDERQRFLHDMGRTVLEAFLRQEGSHAESDSGSLLSDVARRS